MRAVILIGSPGVGKSTTLTLLADTLEADGIANAVVEVESLARAFPYPPLTQALAALPAIVELHRKAGHDLLLAAATPENQGELDALVDAFGEADVIVIRLTARSETAVARVTAREPPDWSGLPQLRNTARVLGARLDSLAHIDRVIATDDTEPAEVVAEVRAAAGI
jgi:dephospho-CoA kinase